MIRKGPTAHHTISITGPGNDFDNGSPAIEEIAPHDVSILARCPTQRDGKSFSSQCDCRRRHHTEQNQAREMGA
jgi:hypothetical protein